MKTVIGATDFMSAGPYYTYDDYPGDIKLLHFSIGRDLQQTGLIPYIKRAQKYGSFALQAPMDYPPDWMLFDIGKHQDVDPRYFLVLAQYYIRYLSDYKRMELRSTTLVPSTSQEYTLKYLPRGSVIFSRIISALFFQHKTSARKYKWGISRIDSTRNGSCM